MSEHVFDQAIALGGDPELRSNTISPAYQNMVGPFGGVTAATLLNAVVTHPEVAGSPVSLTVNYLGPISSESIEIKTRLVRKNRSNQHWTTEAMVEGESVLTATAVTALRRDTWASVEAKPPVVESPDGVDSLPLENMMPWVQNYDMRFIRGNMFEGPDETSERPSETVMWLSDRPQRPLDFLSLASLSDAFFPRLFLSKRDFAPIGTVSFTVYFHVDPQQLAELESPWVLAQARASRFNGSYFDQTGELWSEDGQLLTTTSQIVYYKC